MFLPSAAHKLNSEAPKARTPRFLELTGVPSTATSFDVLNCRCKNWFIYRNARETIGKRLTKYDSVWFPVLDIEVYSPQPLVQTWPDSANLTSPSNVTNSVRRAVHERIKYKLTTFHSLVHGVNMTVAQSKGYFAHPLD